MVNIETKACGPVLPLTLGWEKSARLRKHVLKPSKQYVQTKMQVCTKNCKQDCGEEESQSHARPIYSEAKSPEELEAI
jgi:hypothetical protein